MRRRLRGRRFLFWARAVGGVGLGSGRALPEKWGAVGARKSCIGVLLKAVCIRPGAQATGDVETRWITRRVVTPGGEAGEVCQRKRHEATGSDAREARQVTCKRQDLQVWSELVIA